ncbi:MAG: helix-turn-helix domain-containing protein [Persicimonas sp.]
MKTSDDDSTVPVHDVAAIGRALRSARKEQGLTQQEFADIAGVGVRFLSELERGKQTAEVGLVLRVLANAGYDVVLQRRGFLRR